MTKVRHNYFIFTVFVVLSCFLSSCRKDKSIDNGMQNQADLRVYFKPTVDGNNLVFGKTYTNAFSEDYTINVFKFYIHGIELINSQTNNVYRVDKNEHWLVNTADTAASYVQIGVPASTYNRLSFIIGVDSIRNVSGAQTGALDPAKGMFWTWSTGYIMAKLEGNSPVATTPNNVIEYHVGGFKGGESVLRKVTLDFPTLQNVDLKHGKLSMVTIAANVNTWFNQANQIKISQKPVSMTPGSLATQLADNYSKMFTVVDIVNE